MTRRTTLLLVCAFEIALILFLVAWSAFADTASINNKNILRLFPICEIRSSLGQPWHQNNPGFDCFHHLHLRRGFAVE
jgi:hypothetical protein